MLYSRLGFEYPEREFNEMFLAFRKSFVLNNKKVLHCKIYGNHRYILSDKKCNIILHNANLNWEQRIRAFNPRQGAPTFVKGTMVITLEELQNWASQNPDYLSDYKGQAQLKLNILEGDNGLYLTVDNYKK